MHVPTSRTSKPKAPVKRKTSTARKSAIPLSIFRYGSLANCKANCLPTDLVMKNENGAAINTAMSK